MCLMTDIIDSMKYDIIKFTSAYSNSWGDMHKRGKYDKILIYVYMHKLIRK